MTNATANTKREMTLTRLFDAPRDMVFRCWTEEERLAQWWGPHGFTNPVCNLDVRPGGGIYIVMRGPDNMGDFPMSGVFQEITPPERLVFTAFAEDGQGNVLIEALTTVTFADRDGKTELTVHATGAALTPEAVEMLGGMEEGWSQSLEKLATLVAA